MTGRVPPRPASWDEYERLPEDVRREYIDGQIIVTPFPTLRHSLTIVRLQPLLISALPPSWMALSHIGWKAGADEFGPDVAVVPADAMNDVRKLQKYARAGAPRYWIVDPRDRTFLALVLVDGMYEVAAQLDDDNPVADLDTGAGTISVSLPDLLA